MMLHTAVHSASLGERPVLGVVTKRAFRLTPGKLVESTPAALTLEPLYEERGDDTSIIVDSDLYGVHKDVTDVVLMGTAYSHRGPVTELHTALAIGDVRKAVTITGDRQLKIRANGALSASSPTPFQRMSLGWERAYGGRDREAESAPRQPTRHPTVDDIGEEGAHCYPRNRHGRGFFLDRDRNRLHGAALPNQSDPTEPLDLNRLLASDPCDWLDRPLPAGYGPVGALTFPRCWFFGLGLEVSKQQRPVREVALGAMSAQQADALDNPGELHARAFNCASPGLATTLLRGGEAVELWNLHPAAERFRFKLPTTSPRLMVEPPNAGRFELKAMLTTVCIEPDEDRVTLTWTGTTPAAGVYTPEQCAQMRHAAIWS